VATAGPGMEHSHVDDHRADVFPRLGAWVSCGAVAGVIVALAGHGLTSLPVQVASTSAVLGAFLGTFIGLGRGVWHIGHTSSSPGSASAPDPLWDPWLDSGRDVEDVQPASDEADSGRIEPLVDPTIIDGLSAQRARVRPRILSLETGEAIRLEDEIGRLLQEGRNEQISLVGGPGSGKTTALRHLAAVLPPWASARVSLVDDPPEHPDIIAFGNRDASLVIRAGSQLPADPDRLSYQLTSWNQDDLIEYLLVVHADRCAPVMSRLQAAGDSSFIQGILELWAVVLDQMASDESIENCRTALTRVLEEWFEEHSDVRQIIEDFCLLAIGKNSDLALNIPLSNLGGETSQDERQFAELFRLVRHRPVGLRAVKIIA
jgi:energy-coupling factor transporter ATP-binding protein EcfA2